jgi:hypothetical protein
MYEEELTETEININKLLDTIKKFDSHQRKELLIGVIKHIDITIEKLKSL